MPRVLPQVDLRRFTLGGSLVAQGLAGALSQITGGFYKSFRNSWSAHLKQRSCVTLQQKNCYFRLNVCKTTFSGGFYTTYKTWNWNRDQSLILPCWFYYDVVLCFLVGVSRWVIENILPLKNSHDVHIFNQHVTGEKCDFFFVFDVFN